MCVYVFSGARVLACVCVWVCANQKKNRKTCAFVTCIHLYNSIQANPQNTWPSSHLQVSIHEALTQSISCQVTALRGGEVILKQTKPLWKLGAVAIYVYENHHLEINDLSKWMLLFSGCFAVAQVVEGFQTDHHLCFGISVEELHQFFTIPCLKKCPQLEGTETSLSSGGPTLTHRPAWPAPSNEGLSGDTSRAKPDTAGQGETCEMATG